MNPDSLKSALYTTAMIAGLALAGNWLAINVFDCSKRKRQLQLWGLLLLSVVVGITNYASDAKRRAMTLFEVSGPWAENGNRAWIIEVEHPGVEHTLTVEPFVNRYKNPSKPLNLRCRFGEKGKFPLVDRTTEYEVIQKFSRKSRRFRWRPESFVFTPTRTGSHELIVESADGVVPPLIYLHLSDPEKQDGTGMP